MKVFGRRVSGSSKDLTYAYFVPAILHVRVLPYFYMAKGCDAEKALFLKLEIVSNVVAG